jgi:hypothetical protein
MGKPKAAPAPAQPDPAAVAQAQTASNLQTSIANSYMGNANQYSPMGSMEFNPVGTVNVGGYEVPRWESTQSFSPEQQQLYNQNVALEQLQNNVAGDQMTRLSGYLSQPFDQSNLVPRVQSIAQPQYYSNYQSQTGVPLNYSLGAENITSFDPSFYQGLQSDAGLSATAQGTFDDVGGPQRSIGPQDWSEDRLRVEDAINSRLNPQLDRDRASLENTLVNQGLVRGSQAFNDAMDESNRQANDARMQTILAGGQEQSRLAGLDFNQFQLENSAQQQAYDQAMNRVGFQNQALAQNNDINLKAGEFRNNAATQNLQNYIAGNVAQNTAAQMAFDQSAQNRQFSNVTAQQEMDNYNAYLDRLNAQQQTIFGNQMNTAEYYNTLRERQLQENLAVRNQPISEISALMSGGQPTIPQFTAFRPSPMGETPIGDYTYKGYDTASRNWQAQQQAAAQSRAGMYNLGSSLFGTLGRAATGGMFGSDRRLKRDIRPLGITGSHDLPLYSFKYLWDDVPRVGFMADEVAAVRPDAVANDNLGFALVNYGAL